MQNKKLYKNRLKNLSFYFERENLDCIVIEDTEGRRNSALFYLSGHPSDAVLLVFSDLNTILIPWDEILAKENAVCSRMIPFSNFESRTLDSMLPKVFSEYAENIKNIEISGNTPHPMFIDLEKKLKGINIFCRNSGMDKTLADLRKQKDTEEIKIYRKCSEITNNIIDNIESGLKNKILKTEADIALLIEKKAREAGAEGTGFESLVAGPSRSFAIHSHPSYTNADMLVPGLSIIDFGIKYNGYTSDVTMGIAFNPSAIQKKQIKIVEEAYMLAVNMLKPGISTMEIAENVDSFFKEKGCAMPHALGHGIGLETHEAPVLRNRKADNDILKENMIITIEPGLYSKENGGIRLENDFLITDNGYEQLTNSRIVFLQD